MKRLSTSQRGGSRERVMADRLFKREWAELKPKVGKILSTASGMKHQTKKLKGDRKLIKPMGRSK